jgi:hypothetical protein
MFRRDLYKKYNILVEIEKKIGNKMSSFHHGMYFWSDATSQAVIHRKKLWTHIKQFINAILFYFLKYDHGVIAMLN